jgi:hypothetical protein
MNDDGEVELSRGLIDGMVKLFPIGMLMGGSQTETTPRTFPTRRISVAAFAGSCGATTIASR